MAEITHDELYPLILDGITEGVFTVDADFRLTFMNAAAEAITGIDRDKSIGQKCYSVLRGSICQSGCPLRKSIETGEAQRDIKVEILNAAMETVPISVSTAALRDRHGQMLGGVEIFRDLTELETLRSELKGRLVFHDMVGTSPAMKEIFRLLPDVAETDASVTIEGESGTGKELIAQAIHDLSPRNGHEFVRVNCGALPDTLLESELFGHVKGAFTDARRDKLGRFQLAHEGTLFLDEVGDLSSAFQVKLLRALQEGEVTPLGSTETLRVDVRVLSATNRDLALLVREGSFREDLFYRLRVMPIFVPPLRERREDIVPLIEHIVPRLAARTGKRIGSVEPEALSALHDYNYPGNVRELINILERAFVLCRSDSIARSHLPEEVLRSSPPFSSARGHTLKPSERRVTAYLAPNSTDPSTPTSQQVTADAPSEIAPADTPPIDDEPREIRRLRQALDAHRWHRSATAEALGISRSTLWRLMKQYGLT